MKKAPTIGKLGVAGIFILFEIVLIATLSDMIEKIRIHGWEAKVQSSAHGTDSALTVAVASGLLAFAWPALGWLLVRAAE